MRYISSGLFAYEPLSISLVVKIKKSIMDKIVKSAMWNLIASTNRICTIETTIESVSLADKLVGGEKVMRVQIK